MAGSAVYLATRGHARATTQSTTTLKTAFKDDFRIGASLNRAQFEARDAQGEAIIIAEFNTITPESGLKWGPLHGEPDKYDFSAADAYVSFGEKYNMWIVGHCLVWHAQTPPWVFEESPGKPVSREVLLQRMHEHIRKVVGRYKGRIAGWDVVNEGLNEDGTLRESPWKRIIGEQYIAKAFQFVHEADPAAELYYNDYDLEIPAKRRGAVALIKRLQAQGIPVTAVGMQDHVRLEWPSIAEEAMTIEGFAKLGVKVNITELDVDVLPKVPKQLMEDVSKSVESTPALNPSPDRLPASVQQELAKRYAELFRVFVTHRKVITRVTFWCVTNGDSWLNNWPVRGRTNYPLLIDRNGQPTPVYGAVIGIAMNRQPKLENAAQAIFWRNASAYACFNQLRNAPAAVQNQQPGDGEITFERRGGRRKPRARGRSGLVGFRERAGNHPILGRESFDSVDDPARSLQLVLRDLLWLPAVVDERTSRAYCVQSW